MENYIGMDAHSKTCMFVVVNAKGQETITKRINTSEREILKFIGSVKGKKHLTFEECQLSRWLHVVTKDQVDELLVCNPCFIQKRTGPKNDYLDALHLAQQLRGGFLTPVFHEDGFLSDLRKIVTSYENIINDRIRAKNRYKALFIARGICTKGTTIYSDSKMIEQLDSASQFVARKLLDQVQYLNDLSGEYKILFEENMKTNPKIAALATLPGISAIRANIIAAIVVDPKRFANKNKFWSYCMLVKHDQQSDGRSYGKVTIFGRTSLKNVFMGATLQIFKEECELRRYYEQMTVMGVDKRAARKNLARKLAAISLAIMKTGKPYKEQKIHTIKTNLT